MTILLLFSGGLGILFLGLAHLHEFVGNVDGEVKERIVLLGGRLAGQAVDLGLQGPAEDRGH